MSNVITKAALKVLDAQPLKSIAANPSTPVFILRLLWVASLKNPFNGSIVPPLWKTILANPNTDLSTYEDCTRDSLIQAKLKNPNATEEDLIKIADNVAYWERDAIQQRTLRNIKLHKNATPAVSAHIKELVGF